MKWLRKFQLKRRPAQKTRLRVECLERRQLLTVSTPGLYNPDTGVFFLKNESDESGQGIADEAFQYGPGGLGWKPVVGDWNNDTIDTPGLFDPSTGAWFLTNVNDESFADNMFLFGANDGSVTPIAGDWDGDGSVTVGLYQASTGSWFLKNSNSAGNADLSFQYGPQNAGWLPVVGDWDGNGSSTPGVYDPVNGVYFLRNENTAGFGTEVISYGPGAGQPGNQTGWTPISGDWTDDNVDKDSFGLFHRPNSAFHLKNTLTPGIADTAFNYGPAPSTWVPLAGRWVPGVVNTGPTAVSDAFTVAEDGTLNVVDELMGVLGNDIDPDTNDILTAQLVDNVTHGTLTLNDDGTFTYDPADNFSGTDSFTYRVNDGTTTSGAATVIITVTPVNDAPVALADTYSGVNQGGSLTVAVADGVLKNDTDVETPAALTAQLVGTGPANGTLTLNPNGSFVYTPNPTFFGADTFTYRASDGTATSNTVTVTINVTQVNVPPTAPVAFDDTYTVNEDTLLTVAFAQRVLANDSDLNGDTLTATVVDQPAGGVLNFNSTDGTFTYQPADNFSGPVTFTYRASDGNLTSALATVTINVAPVNDPPEGQDDTYSTDQGVELTVDDVNGVLANDGSDPEGDTTSIVNITQPASGGSVVVNPDDGSFVYTPTAEFTGDDTFTYQLSDGTDTSAAITVTITVNPAVSNTPPVAVNDEIIVTEDIIFSGNVSTNDSDVDVGDTLTFTQVVGPTKGVLTLNTDGSFTYDPNNNAIGPDSFTYKINDGTADSNTATVSININSVNDGPIAVNDTATTNEGDPVTINVLSNDSDPDTGDTLTVSAGPTAPLHGDLTFNGDGTITWTPKQGQENFNGSDTFSYTVSDGTVTANATVTITITPVVDPIVATNDEYTRVGPLASVTVAAPGVLANDTNPDGGTLDVSIAAGDEPANGTVTINDNGSFTYTPDTPATATDDTFTYTVTNGTSTATADVHIVITIPTAPVAVANTYDAIVETQLVIDTRATGVLGNDTDPQNDALTAVLKTPPTAAQGVLNFNPADGTFTFTPADDFEGAATFTYAASDGTEESNIVTVTINVAPLNQDPVAGGKFYTVANGQQLNVLEADGLLKNASDPEGLDVDAEIVTPLNPTTEGTIALNQETGAFIFTPVAGLADKLIEFTFRVTDGVKFSAVQTAQIQVGELNQAPIAVDDQDNPNTQQPYYVLFVGSQRSITVGTESEDVPDLLENDSDPNGDPLTVTGPGTEGVTTPVFGTVTFTPDGGFTYTLNDGDPPDPSVITQDLFSYEISDGKGGTAMAIVKIAFN